MSKNKKSNNKPYTPKGTIRAASAARASASKKPSEKEPSEQGSAADVITPTTRTTSDTTSETRKVESAQASAQPESHSAAHAEKTKPSGHRVYTSERSSSNNPAVHKDAIPSTKVRNALTALGIIGGTIVIGLIATLLGGHLDESYSKPPVYPPDWVFPVVWTVLYISIGIAAYLAFQAVRDEKKRKWDIAWYGIHLFFNFMWPFFYFSLNWLIFSCIWLGFVVATAIVVTYRFYRANLASGIIFTVYTLWLLYALYLSLGITILNTV